LTERETDIFRILVGAFILSASMLVGVLTAAAIHAGQAEQLPSYAAIGRCVQAGRSYADVTSCIGRPPNAKQGSAPYPITCIYSLLDGELKLTFAPSGSLYSAKLTLKNGNTRTILP